MQNVGRGKGEQGLVWTDKRVEQLKRLWADGLSCSQVAGELGGISRSGVIGKINRLGLSGRNKKAKEARPRPRATKPRQQFRLVPPLLVEKPVPPVVNDAFIPLAQRKSILELGHDDCRWPVGNPGEADFFFCAAPTVPGRPYCGGHCKRAYVPAPPRKSAMIPPRRDAA